MGHERVGVLPKSRTWRSIVGQIAGLPETGYQVGDLVSNTLRNVRESYDDLQHEPGLSSAFSFLVLLSKAARETSPSEFLKRHGIIIQADSTPLAVARALQSWAAKSADTNEYSELARKAATDAIGQLYQESGQYSLFGGTSDSFEPWRRTSTGAGFCELTRTFFAKLTERYLRYYLEREASAALPDLAARERFSNSLTAHIDLISRHAFETAKITQSFAAGWFNKNTRHGLPSRSAVDGFLRHALGKMHEELVREGLSS
jgi:hypothetical protein